MHMQDVIFKWRYLPCIHFINYQAFLTNTTMDVPKWSWHFYQWYMFWVERTLDVISAYLG